MVRYLPHTEDDRKQMLADIGVSDVDTLYENVPKECFASSPMQLPQQPASEMAVEKLLQFYANQNIDANQAACFIGAGCYRHHIPATVDYLIQRSEFLTAYTPYQPEVSQGTLSVIFEFQSMIASLTGMEIANASMYDGATAVAEAALMAKRITKRHNVAIYGPIHRHYKEVLTTYKQYLEGSLLRDEIDENTACVIVQLPDFYGNITSLDELRQLCDEHGALLIVAVSEIVSLGMLPAPSMADIVVGEAQSLGVPMQFGGPHVGFFASKEKYVRQMPGRLCGVTTDKDGKRSFVLTLNAREQHIRREKATSNICTNQGLCATAFTIHLSLLGEQGFKELARENHQRACQLADKLNKINGVTVENETFFNEFVIQLPSHVNVEAVVDAMLEQKIMAGLALDENRLLVAVTEVISDEQIDHYANALVKEVA